MGIFKAADYVDVYRIKAKSKRLETMADRDRESTDYINDIIIKDLNISSQDKILDIGCGDGSLLASLAFKIISGFGTASTQEEVLRLKAAHQYQNVDFGQSLTHSLAFPDQSFDKVVCNSVLLILKTREELVASIKEIYRVSKPSAMVYLGEIMIVDELVNARRDYGDSLTKWLIFVLKNRGFQPFVSGLKLLIKSLFSSEPFIITPKTPLVISENDFIHLCESLGFAIIKKDIHRVLDFKGKVKIMPTRMNFVFSKRASL